MDKRFGYFIAGGLVIGAMLGLAISGFFANPLAGLGLGAMVGVFVGWFAAAADREKNAKK